jgi:hypothetical protein
MLTEKIEFFAFSPILRCFVSFSGKLPMPFGSALQQGASRSKKRPAITVD